jgi:hypothetical protein
VRNEEVTEYTALSTGCSARAAFLMIFGVRVCSQHGWGATPGGSPGERISAIGTPWGSPSFWSGGERHSGSSSLLNRPLR